MKRPNTRAPIKSRFAKVNGMRLHYLTAGQGDPVILLHGYAQTSHMWRPLIAELAKTHTVIAPDLRGFGQSAKPARRLRQEDDGAGHSRAGGFAGIQTYRIAGHDIGLMVAYAYAAQYPAEVERIALMDAFLPGIGDWTTNVLLMRDLWHFHFYGETPLKLVKGRERIYFEHFWNDFAANPKKSVSEARPPLLRQGLSPSPARMRAGFEVFKRVRAGRARISRRFAKTKLKMPMLVLTGEKASGEFLIEQGRMVADNVEGVVVKGSGHWLMDEARDRSSRSCRQAAGQAAVHPWPFRLSIAQASHGSAA